MSDPSDDQAPPSRLNPIDPDEQKYLDCETEVELIDAVRAGSPDNPVQPVKMMLSDSFNFRCHRGVSCWNECCHGADITLTPNCILRLSKHLDVRPAEFLVKYTVPAEQEKTGLPVAKLKMGGGDGRGPCPFMTAEGCSVYEDRPATCRYYPLGLASVKPKGSDVKEDFFFLVEEPHCCGHKESQSQTVAEFRTAQELEEFEEVNRGWMDILMKMASWMSLGGPWGQKPSQPVMQMFFMVSTDVDAFRRFVFGTKFLDTYDIDVEAHEALKTDDALLLRLGFDWMKNVMFREPTLAMQEHVVQAAVAKARNDLGAM